MERQSFLYEGKKEHVDPSDSPPPTCKEHQKRAREARKIQLQLYHQREQGVGGTDRALAGSNRVVKSSRRKVSFQAEDRLRDAVVRSDQMEGEEVISIMPNICMQVVPCACSGLYLHDLSSVSASTTMSAFEFI